MKKGCISNEKEFYINRFKEFQSQFRKKVSNTILRTDGSQLTTQGVDIDENKLYFEINQGESTIQTYADRSRIKSYIYSEYTDISQKKTISNYLLSTSGNIKECIVTKVDTGKLYLEVKMGENMVMSEVSIDKVCAFLFGPPDIDFNIHDLAQPKAGYEQEYSGRKAMMEFAVQGFWSYRTAAAMEGVPQNVEEYTDGLRTGLGFGCNLNIYANPKNSFGLLFKYVNNENSDGAINYMDITSTSDDINISFIGLNYQFSSLRKGIFVYNFSIAGGYVAFKNNTTADDQSFTLTGGTYGLSLSNRFNMMMSDNLAFFIDLSIFTGSLQKYKYEGQSIELDQPDNLSRVEVGVGLKLIGE